MDFLWALLAALVIVGGAVFARHFGSYFQQPDEPTLLDAPRVAEQARQDAAGDEPDQDGTR